MSETTGQTKKTREFHDPQTSKEGGILGVFEGVLRRSKHLVLGSILVLIYIVMAALIGLSLIPAVALVSHLFSWSEGFSTVIRLFIQGFSLGLGYLVYGFSLIIIVPQVNRLIRPLVKPFRGPAYSNGAFGWYFHNILIYLVRYTFLDWITPTPFNIFFYQQMGMKIGARTEVNTSNISDAALITLEDGVTVGGSVTIIAHYATGGYLIISPVVIRKNATLGIRAIIMAGVDIGERATILPNSVVLPKTVVPAGETWAGIPAKKLER